MSDLSDEILERALVGEFGRARRVFDDVGSTNDEALKWAAEGAPEGALVVADHQRAGRGRWGRSWWDEPGRALMFSVVLRPTGGATVPGLLTTAAGVAVAEGIERAAAFPCSLKWPNDVTVGGRKLAGILVETRFAGDAPGAAVVGVGINVHWTPEELPPELAERATSVDAELARRGWHGIGARAEVLAAVLVALEEEYAAVRDGPIAVLEKATARSEVLGHTVVVRFPDGHTIEGRATGLADEGSLVVEAEGGQLALAAGEIAELRSR